MLPDQRPLKPLIGGHARLSSSGAVDKPFCEALPHTVVFPCTHLGWKERSVALIDPVTRRLPDEVISDRPDV